MHHQVVILGFILLHLDPVVSYAKVFGTVGQHVTIPCTYRGEITSMCWGRGTCSVLGCFNELIWTDGTRVTFQRDQRYQLKGNLRQRNVSLTIENAVQDDSGLYCCRVEHRGWFNDMKLVQSLEIRLASSIPPTQPTETQPMTLQDTTRTLGTETTDSPLSPGTTDGNGTVTQSSDGLWHKNQTLMSTAHNPWMTTTTEILYAGIGISALVLIVLLAIIIDKKFSYVKYEVPQPRLFLSELTTPASLRTRLEQGPAHPKCSLQSKAKQKTTSTSLMIIFMSWIKTQWCSLRFYAHDGRQVTRYHHIRHLLNSSIIFLCQFHLTFQQVSAIE
ncbi:LOW QUALITY PROTEIN: hepatitis A virus cellular receptor 1 [Carlito syrichta]|uniref:LOW QUALITY PROTEIN: hepatitis A virus cellular receptor 1 n=1 Tax=Carlito syrichta TaxID=1868482 RepID=A0A3Q0E6S8_CARSF|nr:LOW QUALITY PROTEIN: hepatitis A virus cellular receptor 1 [Carlito syrichta]